LLYVSGNIFMDYLNRKFKELSLSKTLRDLAISSLLLSLIFGCTPNISFPATSTPSTLCSSNKTLTTTSVIYGVPAIGSKTIRVSGGTPPYTATVTGKGTATGGSKSIAYLPSSANPFTSDSVIIKDSNSSCPMSTTLLIYNLGSPSVWLDASSVSGSNGATVSQWVDQSGNSNSFSTPSGCNSPTLSIAAVNKKNALQFANSNLQCMANSNSLNFHSSSTGFFVANITDFSANKKWTLSSDNGNSILNIGNGNTLLSKGSADLAVGVYGNPGVLSLLQSPTVPANGFANIAMESTAAPSGFQLMYYTFDGTNGNIYRNGGSSIANGGQGVADALFTGSLSGGTAWANQTQTFIGKDPNSSTSITGLLSEIILYPTVLNTSQMQVVSTYSQSKYSLKNWNWTYNSTIYQPDMTGWGGCGAGGYAIVAGLTFPNLTFGTTLSSITVSLFGAGGGGGNSAGQVGGAGGQYTRAMITPVASRSYSLYVAGSNGPNVTGDTSIFTDSVTSLLVQANGGNTSTLNSSTFPTAILFNGGTGGAMNGNGGGSGGGGAGFSGNGIIGNTAVSNVLGSNGGGGSASASEGIGGGAGGAWWGGSCACQFWGTFVTLSNIIQEGGGGGGAGFDLNAAICYNFPGAGGFPGGGGGSSSTNPSGSANYLLGASGAPGAAIIEYRIYQ
jgi:hypothetical protein